MSLERRASLDANVASSHWGLCPRCCSAIKPGKKFCSQCGRPTSAPVIGPSVKLERRASICPECDFENHHSDRFCKGCGSVLADAATGVPISDPSGHVLSDVKSTGPAPTELRSDVWTGVADSSTPDVRVEANAFPGSNPLDRLQTAQAGTESSPAVASQPAAPQPAQAARSSLFRARNLGVGTLEIVALGALIVASVGVFSMHHRGWPGSRQGSTVHGVLLARPTSGSSVASPAPGPLSPEKQEQRVRSKEPRVPRDKAKSSNAQGLSEDLTNVPNRGAEALAPPSGSGSTLAPNSPNQAIPEPLIPAVEVSKPPSLNPLPDPLKIPDLNSKIQATVPVSVAANLPPLPANAAVPEAGAAGAPTTHASELHVGGVVQRARVLVDPLPAYPALARSRHVGGSVHLIATVRKDGSAANLKVTSGDAMLAGAALDAVRYWRYQPEMLDGQPIESQVDIEVKFHLPE